MLRSVNFPPMSTLLGIDTGGTFTDFVLLREGALSVHKVLSDREAPQRAIMKGIADMELIEEIAGGNVTIIHGTTVATNATLEGKGVPAAYITNRGMKDVLKIGRQTRRELYRLAPVTPPAPFIDALMFEIDCRLDANGDEIVSLTQADLDALKQAVTAANPVAIAINLLFSFLDPAQELAIEALFEDDYFVSRSSNILPEYREYERGMTTWLNAWIGPLIFDYLTRLGESLAPSRLSIMQSSGLTIGADQAAQRAVNLLLSGPAGGLAGSMFIGAALGETRLMTFDMGGTSTDVALLDGEIRLTNEGRVADFPVGVPMADIHTIGAGGGSIAFVDPGGLLQVGPASAGADPGPACYGNGGSQPTVTDANLVLGRLRPDAFLGGRMQLDLAAARDAIAPLAETLKLSVEDVAFGIVRIANEHMTQALRVISVQRGFDPRDFTLACFGGAGGLHFCDLAEALSMNRAIVPVHSGVLSALGMLAASPGREMVRTYRADLANIAEDTLGELFESLARQGESELAQEGVVDVRTERSLDLRYRGQTYTINIPFEDRRQSAAAFHREHKRLYGHELPRDVEVLNIRLRLAAEQRELSLPAPEGTGTPQAKKAGVSGVEGEVSIYDRSELPAHHRLAGPALVTEQHATTLVKAGWSAEVDKVGNLVLTRAAQ